MAFKLFEISTWFGRPICLYEFAWGPKVWRYTSADREVEYGVDEDDNPIIWTPVAISDNGFSQGVQSEPFTVSLPRNLDFALLFLGTPPSTPIILIARRFHKDDPDQQANVYWSGTVGSVRGVDAVKAEVVGLGPTTKRTGLRLGWEVNCPHALYDQGCRVDKELFRHVTTITAKTGISITVADLGLAGERYAGGFIEWEANVEGSIDRRPIDSHGGGLVLNLLGRSDRLEIGQEISLFPGCDLSAETCLAVFNNLANHGGFKFMSKKSPFDGNPVF